MVNYYKVITVPYQMLHAKPMDYKGALLGLPPVSVEIPLTRLLSLSEDASLEDVLKQAKNFAVSRFGNDPEIIKYFEDL